MNQSETRIGVLGMGLAGGVHKKEGGVFIPQSSVKNDGDVTRKMEKVDEDVLTKFLKLLFDRITKDELTLMTSRILECTRMITLYIFGVKNRDESFDYSKLPQVVETGWHTFKLCPMTMDKDERKRVTLKSFDDCLQEKTMVELCQSFAELFLKN